MWSWIGCQTEEHSTEGSRPSIDIRSRIDVMGMLFIKDGLVDLRDKALDKGQTWDGYALHKRWVGRPSHNIR